MSLSNRKSLGFFFFFFNDTATTEIYTLSLHDALPIFADGEVDRSPCGSGTCARLAILAAGGRLPAGTVLQHDSIIGSTFTATVLDTVDAGGRPAIIPQVTGTAYRTGEHLFSIDPHDPLVPGFVLR